VLYSRKDGLWKLADFGFSIQRESKSRFVTTSVREMSCYLAPEFLISDRPSYTNKVDISSLGCILYELAVGTQAFANNFLIFQYKTTQVLPAITLDQGFGEEDKETIQNAVRRMLNLDLSTRPGATEIIGEFSATRERVMTQRPDNIEIYQEFEMFSMHAERLAVRMTALNLQPTRPMLLAAAQKEPVNY